MKIDFFLKLTQIAFYLTGGTIAVLTYLKAKNGLLNTVNTEYQKKALQKVEEISNYLIYEFDEDSEYYWAKEEYVKECVKKMIDSFNQNREIYQKEQKWFDGIPANPTFSRLSNWINKVKSDPFVPKTIREIVVDYLEERVMKMDSIYHGELENFGDSLVKEPEKFINNKDIDAIIHNIIVSKLYDNDCGISQVESKIHELRLKIQKYYEKYDPFIK